MVQVKRRLRGFGCSTIPTPDEEMESSFVAALLTPSEAEVTKRLVVVASFEPESLDGVEDVVSPAAVTVVRAEGRVEAAVECEDEVITDWGGVGI